MVKEILRALCSQGRWSYAVFWRLQRRNRTVLTWEEGFGPLVVQAAGRELPGVGKHQIAAVDAGDELLRVAVAKMCFQVYSLGEGIIGRVAVTGRHQWVFGTGHGVSPGMGSGHLPVRGNLEKYPLGWDSQFAAGIRTIAVIAVAQGVVQLGSVETILEDLDVVACVRSLFVKFQDTSAGIFPGHEAQKPVAAPILGSPFGPGWMLSRSSKSPGGLWEVPKVSFTDNVFLAEAVPETEVEDVSVVSSVSSTEVDVYSGLGGSKCSGAELSFLKDAFLPVVGRPTDVCGKALWKNHEPAGTPTPQPNKEVVRDVKLECKKPRTIQSDHELLGHEVEKGAQALDNDEVTARTCRKRSRLGENVRARPKDRQQIQDRFRELREIVPESNKCSIDSLLERTVRHIHFLGSLSQLKGCNVAKKLKDRASEGVLHNGNDFSPRHMLVEVVLDKKSLLAEVAENIRGLGLTIVKGMMEVKSEKVRACFVVEKRCGEMVLDDARIHATGAW